MDMNENIMNTKVFAVLAIGLMVIASLATVAVVTAGSNGTTAAGNLEFGSTYEFASGEQVGLISASDMDVVSFDVSGLPDGLAAGYDGGAVFICGSSSAPGTYNCAVTLVLNTPFGERTMTDGIVIVIE